MSDYYDKVRAINHYADAHYPAGQSRRSTLANIVRNITSVVARVKASRCGC